MEIGPIKQLNKNVGGTQNFILSIPDQLPEEPYLPFGPIVCHLHPNPLSSRLLHTRATSICSLYAHATKHTTKERGHLWSVDLQLPQPSQAAGGLSVQADCVLPRHSRPRKPDRQHEGSGKAEETNAGRFVTSALLCVCQRKDLLGVWLTTFLSFP